MYIRKCTYMYAYQVKSWLFHLLCFHNDVFLCLNEELVLSFFLFIPALVCIFWPLSWLTHADFMCSINIAIISLWCHSKLISTWCPLLFKTWHTHTHTKFPHPQPKNHTHINAPTHIGAPTPMNTPTHTPMNTPTHSHNTHKHPTPKPTPKSMGVGVGVGVGVSVCGGVSIGVCVRVDAREICFLFFFQFFFSSSFFLPYHAFQK